MSDFMRGKRPRDLSELFQDPPSKKEESNALPELELSALVPFSDHPFKLYTGERLESLVDSIRENGVLQPIVVRPRNDGNYEILAGHNRVNAAKIAGLTQIKADIRKDISDDEAVLIVTVSNFEQRSSSDMLPSELAKSLKMQLEAAKKTGKILMQKKLSNPHGDVDYDGLDQLGPRQHSHQKVAENNKMSLTNIKRYIRLNELIPELLERADEQELALIPAVHLSYLTETEQRMVEDHISLYTFKVDIKKAESLRSFSKSGKLSEEKIHSILSGEEEKKPKKPTGIKLKPKLVTKFFRSDQKPAEIEKIIEEALELYFQNERGSENDGETD